MAQIAVSAISATLLLLSQSEPVASWGNLCDHLIKEEKNGSDLQVFLSEMLAEAEIGYLQHDTPTQVWP